MEQRREQYRAQSVHYLENAVTSLQQGDVEKAGEFLWGSVAEALKAVAARKGQLLRNHREIREYARALSAELQDPTIEMAFKVADQLHSNFYESFLSAEDLAPDAERIRAAVRKLIDLLDVPDQEPSRA